MLGGPDIDLLTFIHTYMPFHFIKPGKPLGFGYETCPQDLTNTIRHTQINTYTYTNFEILKLKYLKCTLIYNFMNCIV